MEHLIEEISKAYREKLANVSNMQKTVHELEKQLTDPNILAKDYFTIEKKIHSLKADIEKERTLADGISHAREIVLDYSSQFCRIL